MPFNTKPGLQKRITYYAVLACVLWTVVIGTSLMWNIKHEYDVTKELALTTARANFFKDQAFRFWASQKGGFTFPHLHELSPALTSLICRIAISLHVMAEI